MKQTDWPQFRGPGGSGVSGATRLPTAWSSQRNVAWKVALPGAGTSSPIVVDGKLLLTCYAGPQRRLVLCRDAQTGKALWERTIAGKLPEQDSIREEHGYASSTLVADKGGVFAFFGKTGVHAFTPDGRPLWQADVGAELNGWGSGASPILFGGLVIVNASVESASLVALDRRTGKERWRASGITESWATPLLVPLPGGRVELVVPIFGKLLAFDPATGAPLWSCATNIASYMAPSPVAHAGVVYCIGGRTNGSLAVRAGGRGNVTETHRLWISKKGGNVSSPIYHDGRLYWGHDRDGTLLCADARTGQLVYEQTQDRPGQFYASGVLADGRLYYTARDGRTFVVAPGPKFALLAVNALDDRSTFNASPAAVDGRLYLRSDRFLYCLAG